MKIQYYRLLESMKFVAHISRGIATLAEIVFNFQVAMAPCVTTPGPPSRSKGAAISIPHCLGLLLVLQGAPCRIAPELEQQNCFAAYLDLSKSFSDLPWPWSLVQDTVEARKLEYHCPQTPQPREERQLA